jgi:guanosine-3',5'-bis(diphosphate) 3'-pyrophosphohydrolase
LWLRPRRTKIKDSLKEEKKAVAEEGKYTLQRKLEGLGVYASAHNIDELVAFYKAEPPLELYYQIAVKIST